jgi:hypothetical protein
MTASDYSPSCGISAFANDGNVVESLRELLFAAFLLLRAVQTNESLEPGFRRVKELIERKPRLRRIISNKVAKSLTSRGDEDPHNDIVSACFELIDAAIDEKLIDARGRAFHRLETAIEIPEETPGDVVEREITEFLATDEVVIRRAVAKRRNEGSAHDKMLLAEAFPEEKNMKTAEKTTILDFIVEQITTLMTAKRIRRALRLEDFFHEAQIEMKKAAISALRGAIGRLEKALDEETEFSILLPNAYRTLAEKIIADGVDIDGEAFDETDYDEIEQLSTIVSYRLINLIASDYVDGAFDEILDELDSAVFVAEFEELDAIGRNRELGRFTAPNQIILREAIALRLLEATGHEKAKIAAAFPKS